MDQLRVIAAGRSAQNECDEDLEKPNSVSRTHSQPKPAGRAYTGASRPPTPPSNTAAYATYMKRREPLLVGQICPFSQ